MFYELNFEIMFFTLVSSTLSTGIIVDTIRPLSMGIIVVFGFVFLKMNNLQLAIPVKVPHGWVPFEKSHMIGHYLIFVDQRKNVIDFGIYMKVFYSNLI